MFAGLVESTRLLWNTSPSVATFRAINTLANPKLMPWAVLLDHFMVKN
jgi:hypothetical protein